MKANVNSIGIIGFGRFGQLLADLLKADFDIGIYDNKPLKGAPYQVITLSELNQFDTLFLAVPIRQVDALTKQIAPHVCDSTVMDVCSIKRFPVRLMQQHLADTTGIISSHPMFGPDSIMTQAKPKWVMHPIRDTQNQFSFWENYLKEKFEIVNLTPDQHDQFAAYSQGITHLVGRVLEAMDITSTPIDTLGFEQLLKLMQQTCNDSPELFIDLQTENPYSNKMLSQFSDALSDVLRKIKG